LLIPDTRPPPIFVGDARALDFLNSTATPVDTPIEWLGSGTDLLDWLAAAKLVPPEVMTSMRRAALPGELDAVAAQARALREWFRGFVQQYKGKPLKPEALKDLAPLNRILERDQEFGQIFKRDPARDGSGSSGVALRQMRRWQTADTLLLPIAETMAELICTEDFSKIKACEGAVCTLLFLDRSHVRGRRWCSMALCGNRVKQAAHRKRERRAPS
jgi:predicted RNA-binding Zn ribbon-like protein